MGDAVNIPKQRMKLSLVGTVCRVYFFNPSPSDKVRDLHKIFTACVHEEEGVGGMLP